MNSREGQILMPITSRTIQIASYATVNELKQIPFSFAKALLSESKFGTNLNSQHGGFQTTRMSILFLSLIST